MFTAYEAKISREGTLVETITESRREQTIYSVADYLSANFTVAPHTVEYRVIQAEEVTE
jgi:hypothetical protein